MSSYTIRYKAHNNVVYSCTYHVVWCPKYRRAVLANGVDVRLKEMIQSVCTASRAELLQLEVMPDHAHLLVEVDPQYGIPRLVRSIKGRSSRLLRQGYLWLKSSLAKPRILAACLAPHGYRSGSCCSHCRASCNA